MAKRIERHAKSLGVAVRVDVVGLGDEAALADLVELGIRDPTNPRGEVLVSYGFDDDDVACALTCETMICSCLLRVRQSKSLSRSSPSERYGSQSLLRHLVITDWLS